MNTSRIAGAIGMAALLFGNNSFADPFETISERGPAHLIASTGNVYWTSYEVSGPTTANVWRASKNAKPGEERLLYSETVETGYKPFGNIVYARVDDWYGYFIANDMSGSNENHSSSIKRIPLAGGGATTIATLARFVGNRSLRTDGQFLYWVDTDGIRRRPINGETIETLAATVSGFHLELGADFVYYSDQDVIRRVRKTGGNSSAIALSPYSVSALHIHESGDQTRIYWGDEGAGVYTKLVGSNNVTAYMTGPDGYRTTSVGFDGNRVMWTMCTVVGNAECWLHGNDLPGFLILVPHNVENKGFHSLRWDDKQVIFGSASGVHKRAF